MMPQRADAAPPARVGAPLADVDTRVLHFPTCGAVPSFTAVVRVDLARGTSTEARRVLERITLAERRGAEGPGDPLPDWMGVDVFVKDAPPGKWRVFVRPEAPARWSWRLIRGGRG